MIAAGLWLLIISGCGEPATRPPTPIKVLDGCGAVVHAVAFSPDGSLLASGNADGEIMVYAIAAKREPRALTGCEGQVYGLTFDESAKQLFSGTFMLEEGRQGNICIYSLANQDVKPMSKRVDRQVTWLAYIPKMTLLLTEHAISPPQLKLWTVPDLRQTGSLQLPFDNPGDGPTARAVSADGKFFAYVTNRGRLRIVDLTALREIANYEGWDAVAFSPSGDRLAVFAQAVSSEAMLERRCHLLDVRTGRVVQQFEPGGTSANILAFSGDGMELLCGGGRDVKEPGRLVLWNTKTGTVVQSFDALGGPVSVIGMIGKGDDERVAVGGYGGAIKVWALSDLRKRNE